MGALRVGIVGFGSIAEHSHFPAWQSFPNVEVVAIADVSPERRARVAEIAPHVNEYTSPCALIEQANVDVLDICTPPTSHAGFMLAALRSGIRTIVCEKPFVLTAPEYASVARERERTDARIISVNNWVHSDFNRLITESIHAGEIGQVTAIEMHIGRPDAALGNAGWNPRWRTDATHAGGGIILDHGWHQFYLMMGWMGSTPHAVSAITRTANPAHGAVEDEASVILHFPTGDAQLDLAWTSRERTNRGVIRGDQGVIRAEDDRILVETAGHTYERRFGSRLSVSSYHPEWFRSVFQYNVVTQKTAEACRNFREAGILVHAIEATYHSAGMEGAPCSISQGRLLEEAALLNGTHNGGPSAP